MSRNDDEFWDQLFDTTRAVELAVEDDSVFPEDDVDDMLEDNYDDE